MALGEAILEIEQAAEVAAGLADGSLDELARALLAVEATIDRLQLLRGEVRDQLAARMPGARARTPVGVLETAKEGGSTVWDHSKVWPAVYRQARRRADKGFEPVDAALAAVREAAPDPVWRSSVLAGWGVDVDQVATRVPARRTVHLTPNRPRT
jgi:hypothetical protein